MSAFRAVRIAFAAATLIATALTGGIAGAAPLTGDSVPDYYFYIPQSDDGPLLLAIATDASQVSRVTDLVAADQSNPGVDGFVTPEIEYYTIGPVGPDGPPCTWHLYTVTTSGEFIEHSSGEIQAGIGGSVPMGPAFDDPYHNDLFQVDNCATWVRWE
ncbi:hypothetical protein BFN03_02165 [Rhodococcus sp. WMMA185]|uniref:hypothetical protein n=1 Tax=Rhodococcus sp. WMMA185 TaxID=679318 RepID=UPI000878D1C6|nr:hypothetical protein [Rhodococcus sp. WMMA185]AOW91902.1 hypothetical protein BFN03_02165 [Rhodococcus sp. WMMA185]